MADEIGKVIPIDVLRKLAKIGKDRGIIESERHMAWFSDRDIEEEKELAEMDLDKIIADRSSEQQ